MRIKLVDENHNLKGISTAKTTAKSEIAQFHNIMQNKQETNNSCFSFINITQEKFEKLRKKEEEEKTLHLCLEISAWKYQQRHDISKVQIFSATQ